MVRNGGVHRPKHTVSPLKSDSRHEVDETVCCKDIEMADRPGNCPQEGQERRRGEVSAIMNAKNLEPHMFMEREAMAVHRSLS